jgi:hypothetical protein
MERFEDRKNEMNLMHKYIIDIEMQHTELLRALAENRMDKDLVKIEFADLLDTIMGTAYKLITGDVRGSTMDKLYKGILDEFFSNINNDEITNYICSRIERILNGFLIYLISLNITSNRVLFIENVTSNGIFIAEYDISNLK